VRFFLHFLQQYGQADMDLTGRIRVKAAGSFVDKAERAAFGGFEKPYSLCERNEIELRSAICASHQLVF